MTVTLVYGDAADGYVSSTDASYANARNGPPDAVHIGNAAYYGQNNNSGVYTVFQTFIRFAYPAVSATDLVASAAVVTTQAAQLSTGVSRDMEVRAVPWGTVLNTSDWQSPTQVSSAVQLAVVRGVQASQGKVTHAGSETLRASVQSTTTQEYVVVSSRQRAGTTPTSDEGSAIYTADASGTYQDPLLIFTTIPRASVLPGMEVQLSDGSWVFGVRPGSPSWATSVTLIRETQAGTTATIGTISFGTSSATWADVPSSLPLSLAVDSADNLYVVGRAGDASNSVRSRAYVKASGSWSWTAGTIRTASLPAHNAPINSVATAWHPTAGGTLAVFAGHAPGEGQSVGNVNDLSYVLLSSQYLLTGAGTHVRGTGSAQSVGLVPTGVGTSEFNGFTNEVGAGLEVQADHTQPAWGYLASFRRSQRPGQNAATVLGRYILLDDGAAFSHVSYQETDAWSRKDASTKIRLLAVGSGQVALVTADPDIGYGLTVQVYRASGTTSGFVELGWVALAAEGIPSMPDGPAVASSLAWDAIYNATENAVWVYYVDSSDATRLRRTSISMDTYLPTLVEAPSGSLTAADILSVRAPRNARATQQGHVTVGLVDGTYTRVVETFNVAPTAPTLAPRANYDATADADFAWTFEDPNTGDTQSAYQLQVERIDTGAGVLDTGKVTSTTPSRTVTGGTLANELEYRWRVMTWDALDTASPWSDWSVFATSAGGSVNITDPATDNPAGVITDDIAVTWSVTGTVQASYRAWVTRGDTGATVHDSGWVTSTDTSALVAGMVSDVEHTISVQVRNASAVPSGIGVRLVTPSYAMPETPLITVTPVPDGGYVLVDVENPPPEGDRPEVVRNRILRRQVGSQDAWEVLGVAEPNGPFRDYTAPSQVPMEYRARGETV